MSSYMMDIANLKITETTPVAKHSTSKKKDNTSLDMTDFLNLMIVQLQNQSIDSSMDTSDMLNQMVQMQMITALTTMTDASVMSYANSLVGKEVTIGIYDGTKLEERVLTVTGTGISNGENVIFAGDEVYKLSDIMAVGRLPSLESTEKPGDKDDTTDAPSVTDPDAADKTPEVTDPDQTTPDIGSNGADVPPVTETEDVPNSGSGEEIPPVSGTEEAN